MTVQLLRATTTVHREAIRKQSGPYDILYGAAPQQILWRTGSSRLLAHLPNDGTSISVLDAGCGDGCNAVELERRGFDVVGVDVSQLALRGLRNRFARARINPRGRYERKDVRTFLSVDRKFDVLLSTGLFQCLERPTRIAVHRRLQRCVRPGGLVLFSCLTDEIPLPNDHKTPNISLATFDELKRLFKGWEVLSEIKSQIDDAHEPLVRPHRHSVSWIVARKPLAAR